MTVKRGRKSDADITRLAVVDLTGARVQPPDHLTEDEVAEWHAIVDSLPADYFRPADIPLLAVFCTASAIYKIARAEVYAEGITLINERGNSCKNPATDIMAQQASAMAQVAVKLRLCPSSRYSEKQAATKAGDKAKGKRPWEAASNG